MAAHAVAEDAEALQIHGQLGTDLRQQVVQDVAFHAPVQGPRAWPWRRGEARAHAEVPGIGLAGQARRAGWCLGR